MLFSNNPTSSHNLFTYRVSKTGGDLNILTHRNVLLPARKDHLFPFRQNQHVSNKKTDLRGQKKSLFSGNRLIVFFIVITQHALSRIFVEKDLDCQQYKFDIVYDVIILNIIEVQQQFVSQ